jgi:hypothetical protein
MKDKPAKDDELAEEARLWDERKLTPAGWEDAPEAIPRVADSMPISIRLPRQMIAILKESAKREGIGYQVLIKQWLDDRIRHEHARQKRDVRLPGPIIRLQAAVFQISPTFSLTAEANLDVVGQLASRLPVPG